MKKIGTKKTEDSTPAKATAGVSGKGPKTKATGTAAVGTIGAAADIVELEDGDLPMELPIKSRARFSLGPQATWRELFPFTGHDDAALRRREREIDPERNEPWIPPARLNKRDTHATLMGICRYKDFLLGNRDGLPGEFATMGDFEAQTRFPKEMIKYALNAGCQCRASSNRIKLMPFLDFFNPILKQIFSAGGVQIKGLKGFEELDSDFQLARKLKEQADELVDARLIRHGSMVQMDKVEEMIWEKGLGPLRESLLGFSKMYAGQVNPENPAMAKQVIDAGIATILKKIDAMKPKKMAEPTPEQKAA